MYTNNSINLVPIFVAGANCKENALFTIANFYQKDYELLLTDTYNSKESNIYDYLHPYCNIRTVKTSIEETSDLNWIFNELKKQRPLLIHVDTFYCEHLLQYRKYHMKHFFVAYKIENNNIYFVDPNIGENIYTIS